MVRRPCRIGGIARGTDSTPSEPGSIRGAVCRVLSRISERAALDGAHVHAKSSREFGEVIRIPCEPKRDRDDACLGEASGWHLRRFANQRDELFVAR